MSPITPRFTAAASPPQGGASLSTAPLVLPCHRPQIDWAKAPLYVVLNGRSGKHDGSPPLPERLAAHFDKAGRAFKLFQPGQPRQLPAMAAEAAAAAVKDGAIVVAAGGDGTINAVVQAIWRHQVPMGVLPQGTFNFFGRAHGVSQVADEGITTLLQALAEHHLKPVQIGLVNDQVFLVNASLGLYPELLEDRERMKRRYGRSRLVAWFAAIATMMRPHRSLQIQLEQSDASGATRSEQRRIATLFVGNNPLQLELVGLEEAEAVRAGHLAALTLAPMGKFGLAGLAVRGWLGRLGAADEVNNFAFTHLQIERLSRRAAGGVRSGKVKVAFDGESARLPTPLQFRVAPLPLWLVVPPDLAPIP